MHCVETFAGAACFREFSAAPALAANIARAADHGPSGSPPGDGRWQATRTLTHFLRVMHQHIKIFRLTRFRKLLSLKLVLSNR